MRQRRQVSVERVEKLPLHVEREPRIDVPILAEAAFAVGLRFGAALLAWSLCHEEHGNLSLSVTHSPLCCIYFVHIITHANIPFYAEMLRTRGRFLVQDVLTLVMHLVTMYSVSQTHPSESPS